MRGRSLFLSVLLATAVTVAVVLAAGAAAARPLVVDHTGPVYDKSDNDELCGIPGTNTTRFVGNFKLYTDGTFLSTGNFREVFTATSGKQIITSGVEQVTGPFDPVDNGDGTITETFVFKGLPVKLKVGNGPTLVRDAGNATVAITFRLNTDGTLDFVSQSVLLEKGPHPTLDDDSLFCDAVVSALT